MLSALALLTVVRSAAIGVLMVRASRSLLGAEGVGGARRAAWALDALRVLAPRDATVAYLEAMSAMLQDDGAGCRDALVRMARDRADASAYGLAALARAGAGEPLPDPGELPPAGGSAREPLMLATVALSAGRADLAQRCLELGSQGQGQDYLYHWVAGLCSIARGERGKARDELLRAVHLRGDHPTEAGLGIEVPVFRFDAGRSSTGLKAAPWSGRFVTARRMAIRASVELMYGLAFLERAAGDHARSMSWADLVLRRHARDAADCGLADILERLAYPINFGDALGEAARAHGVDPMLVLAIVREESHFDPAAVSHAGAQGLMQLMPRTGQWVAQRLGQSGWSDHALMGVAANLDLGCAYVAYLQGEIGQSREAVPWVLAAYNGGLSNARRWMEQHVGPQQAIDFPETRDYVERVTTSYRSYARLYGNRSTAAQDTLDASADPAQTTAGATDARVAPGDGSAAASTGAGRALVPATAPAMSVDRSGLPNPPSGASDVGSAGDGRSGTPPAGSSDALSPSAGSRGAVPAGSMSGSPASPPRPGVPAAGQPGAARSGEAFGVAVPGGATDSPPAPTGSGASGPADSARSAGSGRSGASGSSGLAGSQAGLSGSAGSPGVSADAQRADAAHTGRRR